MLSADQIEALRASSPTAALGCVGMVTDGAVRDLDEVRALGLPLCAAPICVCCGNVHLVEFEVPVQVGGVWIQPGDLLHGDPHGVVVMRSDGPGDLCGHGVGRTAGGPATGWTS
jgi:regulator of RNase E activity RraA